MSEDRTVVLTNVRLLFTQLLEPKPVMRNGKPVGEPKYSVTILLDEGQEKQVKAALLAAAKEKWPGRDLKADVEAKEFNWPVKSEAQAKAEAEKKDKNGDVYDGYSSVKADSQYAPELYYGRTKVDPNMPGAARVFYSGVYANVQLNANAYEGVSGGSDGVKFYLQAVVKTKDGERLIGGGTRDEVFAGVDGGESDEDPTAGADDIPF